MTLTADLDLHPLAAAVTGPVLTPDHPDYAAETLGFNAAHPVAASVVVGAADTADVAAAVRWGVAAGLPVRVQATGHGLVDNLDDVLLITTRRLDGVTIDPEGRSARVGAGVRWRAVIDAAAAYGLAPLSGSSSTVGVVGYTLGGGLGPLGRRYGWAADHVRALTLVTADGEVRRVDPQQHPDLFWALRGGKLGFGVVTEIEIDLVPVSRFYGGGLFFPAAEAGTVLPAWRDWTSTLPEEVTTAVALLRLPPDPHLPPPLSGQFVVHLRYAHFGDPDAGEQLLAPMRQVAPLIMDTVAELPWAAIDAVAMDPPNPVPAHDRGLSLAELPDAAIAALVESAGVASDSVLAIVELRLLGGALARPAAIANAVTGRDAAYGVYVLGVPVGPTGALVPGQVDRVVDALAPWRTDGLLNFVGHGRPGDVAALWSAEDRDRLRQTAERYDPTDAFGGGLAFG